MDAIKKKMQSLKTETDNALQRAEELDKDIRYFIAVMVKKTFPTYCFKMQLG